MEPGCGLRLGRERGNMADRPAYTKDAQPKVLAFINDRTRPVTIDQTAKALGWTQNRARVTGALAALAEKGLIVRVATGVYQRCEPDKTSTNGHLCEGTYLKVLGILVGGEAIAKDEHEKLYKVVPF